MISTFQHFNISWHFTNGPAHPTFQHFNISSFHGHFRHFNISTFQHFNISWPLPTFQHFNISTFHEHTRQPRRRSHISTFQHFNISRQLLHISRPAPPPPRPRGCDSSRPTQYTDLDRLCCDRFRVCFFPSGVGFVLFERSRICFFSCCLGFVLV